MAYWYGLNFFDSGFWQAHPRGFWIQRGKGTKEIEMIKIFKEALADAQNKTSVLTKKSPWTS